MSMWLSEMVYVERIIFSDDARLARSGKTATIAKSTLFNLDRYSILCHSVSFSMKIKDKLVVELPIRRGVFA